MRVLNAFDSGVFVQNVLPVANSLLVQKRSGLEYALKEVGFPAVLKLVSSGLVHKTDVGGVKIVRSMEEAGQGWNSILSATKKSKLAFNGVLVQEFVEGEEVIVGVHRDPTFGPVLMLGLGGVFVEVLKDVVFRACPVSKVEAQRMIECLTGKEVLYGARGKKRDVSALNKVMVRLSDWVMRLPELQSLDVNPLILQERGAKAVDARVVLE